MLRKEQRYDPERFDSECWHEKKSYNQLLKGDMYDYNLNLTTFRLWNDGLARPKARIVSVSNQPSVKKKIGRCLTSDLIQYRP